MTSTLVDSNILLDIVSTAQSWNDWSARKLQMAADEGEVIINPIIYAEASIRFFDQENFEQLIIGSRILKEPLPWDAAFAAGKAHGNYRRSGGIRERTLPDFFIGAHALVKGYQLLTRDARRYRVHFPTVDIIAPDTHP
ncbi:MAG TPA: type II toxin-antitoxin system VapC family toxin [Aestuariivirgaceae bacterium]|nr:type II toxin-antitoxin system VapC family toxin [Aestuariivirgaceae bacterium]